MCYIVVTMFIQVMCVGSMTFGVEARAMLYVVGILSYEAYLP